MDSLLRKDCAIVTKDTKIGEAIGLLDNLIYKVALFLEDSRICGIATESDFLSAFLRGFSYDDLAFDVATKDVFVLHSNRTAEYAIDVLISKNLKYIPVVDDSGAFLGLLTLDTLIEYFENLNNRLKLKIGMLVSKSTVISVTADRSLKECIQIISDNKIGFLPIVQDGKFVGSITESDILSIIKDRVSFDEQVGNFICRSVELVDDSISAEETLSIMKQKSISHVVVTNGGGKPIGVLSKRDLTRNIKDNYKEMLEKKLKSARDSLYVLPTPILEVEKSNSGYYIVWHNSAAREILDVDLFDFRITDIIQNEAFATALVEAYEKNSLQSVEIELFDKSFDISFVKIDNSTLQLVFHDITYLKKDSERLKTIIDILPQIVLVTDGKKISSVNRSFLDFLGYSDLQEFLRYHNCICEKFLPQDGFLMPDSSGGSWLRVAIEKTKEDEECYAKMFDIKKGEERVFLVKAVELDLAEQQALITLFDITESYAKRALLELQTKELEKMATTDSLTGVYNRNKLKEVAIYEFKKIKRERYPLSLIIFDIDHFKQVNDRYGHNVGDYVLKTIASLVQSLIRSSDTFARWGGEEFIILAPNTALENALYLAEKLRAAIEKYNFDFVEKVTCSFGVAEFANNVDFEGLVERADKALYAAKRSGRNRVESF